MTHSQASDHCPLQMQINMESKRCNLRYKQSMNGHISDSSVIPKVQLH